MYMTVQVTLEQKGRGTVRKDGTRRKGRKQKVTSEGRTAERERERERELIRVDLQTRPYPVTPTCHGRCYGRRERFGPRRRRAPK